MPPDTTRHAKFHFSVKCHTDDLAVLSCLRALNRWAQKDGNREIGYGGTADKDWQLSNHTVTFRFTSPAFRQSFIQKAEELLLGRWTTISTSDNDPAAPQRRI